MRSGASGNSEPRTIITLGVARGGTSLIAGTLHHLGVFSGDACHSPVFEDCRLSDAIENRSSELAADVIEEYNQRYDIWAWKRPGSLRYLTKLHKLARNPHYIIVFKDLLAIANRNCISMGFELDSGLQSALKSYTTLLKFIRTNKSPKLLVSYEKAVEDEVHFIDELCSFLQLTVADEQKQTALQFVQPNSVEYLENTRANRIIGRIESVGSNTVCGWSSHAHRNISQPVELQLLINGQPVQQLEANEPRAGAQGQGASLSRNTGFTFTLEKHCHFKHQDEIRVVEKQTSCDIEMSPWIFTNSNQTLPGV